MGDGGGEGGSNTGGQGILGEENGSFNGHGQISKGGRAKKTLEKVSGWDISRSLYHPMKMYLMKSS